MCSSTIVLLNIQDFNDEAPMFDQAEYTTDICQTDATVNSPLIRPVATDGDSGTNGLLSYSFRQSTSLFAIEANSGLISIGVDAATADIRSHELIVVAADGGPVSQTGTTSVTVRILDCSTVNFHFTRPYQSFMIEEATNIFTGGEANINIPLSGNAMTVGFAPDTPINPFSNLLNVS